MPSETEKWNAWVSQLANSMANTSVKVSNIEKTLEEYQNKSMRMLWITQLLILGVIGLNGLLLFYK
tara:strand:- start:6230 stop:6427 length:198 start_codon:yes stop_codon:yes gene_type:complete